MKVLHVITSLRTGGAEKLMVDLLPRLKTQGIDVELVLLDGVRTAFRSELETKGIKVYDLGVGGSVYSPIKFLRLLPYIRKYDIVHTHNTASQFFVAIANIFSKTKFITTEHGGSNRRRYIKGFKIIDRWMYNQYDRIICISLRAEKSLRSYLGKCKTSILTINNGVDINRYASALPSVDLDRIAPDSRKIMMVAGFRWEKDQDTLIRALKHLPSRFHLFLVGDGARRNELENLIKAEDLTSRVHLLGVRNDVPNLLHAADYIVMSSHFEGLSLSSVEGMCVGKPFIASDVDGLREVVSGAGALFPHQDANSLATEILRLEENSVKYNETAALCAKRAANFDISKMVTGYCLQYTELMKS